MSKSDTLHFYESLYGMLCPSVSVRILLYGLKSMWLQRFQKTSQPNKKTERNNLPDHFAHRIQQPILKLQITSPNFQELFDQSEQVS